MADIDNGVEFMVLYVFQILIIFVVEFSYFVVDGVQLIDSLYYFLLLRLELVADSLAMVQGVVVSA